MKQTLSETCYQFFATLANPTRLAIMELLRDGSKNVTQISTVLGQEQSMISHNLKPLERCRFVFSERRKKEMLYSLNKETIEKLFKIFSHHAKKYCPTKGKCPTERKLRELRKQEASGSLYVSHT